MVCSFCGATADDSVVYTVDGGQPFIACEECAPIDYINALIVAGRAIVRSRLMHRRGEDMYYIGSLWHEYADPFVTVVATTEAVCWQELDRLAEAEYNSCLIQDSDDGREYQDDIMTSGVSEELDYAIFVDDAILAGQELAESGIHVC